MMTLVSYFTLDHEIFLHTVLWCIEKDIYGHIGLGNGAHWIHFWGFTNAHPHIKSFEK